MTTTSIKCSTHSVKYTQPKQVSNEVFVVTELDIYGMHYHAKGMSIQQQKISANPQRDATEDSQRSPKPTRIGQILHTANTQQAFHKLKAAFTTDPVANFQENWKTVLSVDASPVGLGAIFLEEDQLDHALHVRTPGVSLQMR